MADGQNLGQGIGRFVSTLANADQIKNRAELDAYRTGLASEELKYRALQAQRRNDAQQRLGDYFRALGLSNPDAMAGVILAQPTSNPAEVGQFMGDVQSQNYRRQARDALASGDRTGGNADLAAVNGKPLERTRVQGGVAFDPYATPGQDMHALPSKVYTGSGQHGMHLVTSQDGRVYVVHPDGHTTVLQDAAGNPIRRSMFEAAARVYSSAHPYPNAPGTPSFLDFYNGEFQKIIGARSGAKPQETGASSAPPASVLKEGINTTFENGQVWTLENGKPKRVK